MSQLDEFREQIRLAKRDDVDRQEAAASEPRKAFPQKTVRKKNVRLGPKCPDRTSLSLSRETSARLDCYKFWLRRHAGKDYPSYSALIDNMLDKVLALDKDAKAFVSEHGDLF